MKIYAILLVLLILAACGPKEDDYPITDKDYKKGTDGLVFEFHPHAPPTNIFEETDFEVATDIWNKGAYPATQGYVTALLENSYMCVLSGNECVKQTGTYNPLLTKPLGELSGRAVATPDGTSKFIDYKIKAQKLDLLTVEHTLSLMISPGFDKTQTVGVARV